MNSCGTHLIWTLSKARDTKCSSQFRKYSNQIISIKNKTTRQHHRKKKSFTCNKLLLRLTIDFTWIRVKMYHFYFPAINLFFYLDNLINIKIYLHILVNNFYWIINKFYKRGAPLFSSDSSVLRFFFIHSIYCWVYLWWWRLERH